MWSRYATFLGGKQKLYSHNSNIIHIVRRRGCWLVLNGSSKEEEPLVFTATYTTQWDFKAATNLENSTLPSFGLVSSVPLVLVPIYSFMVRWCSISSVMRVNSSSEISESIIAFDMCWWTVLSLVLATCIRLACFTALAEHLQVTAVHIKSIIKVPSQVQTAQCQE